MKRLNFSPVVMLIIGVVPFLLMVVQWVTEDVIGVERAINYMTRWEVIFQIGVEMLLLGIVLWCLDWLKEFIRLRKWRREFISEWQKDYRELDEEEARLEHLRREADKLNRETFMREYYCQPTFDEDVDESEQSWRIKNNAYLGIPEKILFGHIGSTDRTYPFGIWTVGVDVDPKSRTNYGNKF